MTVITGSTQESVLRQVRVKPKSVGKTTEEKRADRLVKAGIREKARIESSAAARLRHEKRVKAAADHATVKALAKARKMDLAVARYNRLVRQAQDMRDAIATIEKDKAKTGMMAKGPKLMAENATRKRIAKYCEDQGITRKRYKAPNKAAIRKSKETANV